MTDVKLCWCFCGLFVAMLIWSFAITIHPEVKARWQMVMLVEAVTAIGFGTLPMTFLRTNLRVGQWLIWTFASVAFAVCFTLVA